MKYELIGWTYLGDRKFKYRGDAPEYMEELIIEELAKKGYCFGGDAHEEYCPVFNDGTYISYSWRGWGRVMATARGEYTGGVSYMGYYMNMVIDEDKIKYPPIGVDCSKIKSRDVLRETFEMPVDDNTFVAIESGKRRVEVRLRDAAYKSLCRGDFIDFVRSDGGRVRTRVTDMTECECFDDLLDCVNRDNPGVAEAFGFEKDMPVDDLIEELRKRYLKLSKKSDDVVAYEVELAAHTCTTYLKIDDSNLVDTAEFEEALSELTPDWIKTKNGYRVGYDDDYNVDVNKMIRRTISGLKECPKVVKSLQKDYGVCMYLEIVARIVAESQVPEPILSLDDDIIRFLSRAGVKHDLDYYVTKE